MSISTFRDRNRFQGFNSRNRNEKDSSQVTERPISGRGYESREDEEGDTEEDQDQVF